MTLHDDGSVTVEYTDDVRRSWYVADDRHFHILHDFPPNPNVPGMAEGAQEDEEYEIISLSADRLVEHQFDYEADGVWRRVDRKSPNSK